MISDEIFALVSLLAIVKCRKWGVVNRLRMRIVQNLVEFPPPLIALHPPLSGGAIFASMDRNNINSSIVTQCQYFNNTASINGGAICKNRRNWNLLIHHNSYINNRANAFGGAIYVNGTNSSVSVTSTTFINTIITFMNNTAMREGGGAIYSNGQYANVTLTYSTFHNNSDSYCSVLDVDNFNHFSKHIHIQHSIWTNHWRRCGLH